MFSNSNSFAANGNSSFMAADDWEVLLMVLGFRYLVPGLRSGWRDPN